MHPLRVSLNRPPLPSPSADPRHRQPPTAPLDQKGPNIHQTSPNSTICLEQRYRGVSAQRQYAGQPRRGQARWTSTTPPFNPLGPALPSTAALDGLKLASLLFRRWWFRRVLHIYTPYGRAGQAWRGTKRTRDKTGSRHSSLGRLAMNNGTHYPGGAPSRDKALTSSRPPQTPPHRSSSAVLPVCGTLHYDGRPATDSVNDNVNASRLGKGDRPTWQKTAPGEACCLCAPTPRPRQPTFKLLNTAFDTPLYDLPRL